MICLNKRSLLTHGSPLSLAALTQRFKPSAESYTAVIESCDEGGNLFGQVLHATGERSARLNFVAADYQGDGRELCGILDELNRKAGEMGALNVLAELEETSPVFELLRKAGYIVYGWETAWKLPRKMSRLNQESKNWQIALPADDPQLKMLYQSLVPPVVQAAEAYSNGGTRRLVYREKEEIVAYVESSAGPNGLYLRPLVHPSVIDSDVMFGELVGQFADLGQPVYLQVRSYQAWLLDALESIGGEVSEHFTLLVKHLAVQQRNGVIITNRAIIENRQTEPSAPMVNQYSVNDPPAQQ